MGGQQGQEADWASRVRARGNWESILGGAEEATETDEGKATVTDEEKDGWLVVDLTLNIHLEGLKIMRVG